MVVETSFFPAVFTGEGATMSGSYDVINVTRLTDPFGPRSISRGSTQSNQQQQQPVEAAGTKDPEQTTTIRLLPYHTIPYHTIPLRLLAH